jgi:hypothetical protein
MRARPVGADASGAVYWTFSDDGWLFREEIVAERVATGSQFQHVFGLTEAASTSDRDEAGAADAMSGVESEATITVKQEETVEAEAAPASTAPQLEVDAPRRSSRMPLATPTPTHAPAASSNSSKKSAAQSAVKSGSNNHGAASQTPSASAKKRKAATPVHSHAKTAKAQQQSSSSSRKTPASASTQRGGGGRPRGDDGSDESDSDGDDSDEDGDADDGGSESDSGDLDALASDEDEDVARAQQERAAQRSMRVVPSQRRRWSVVCCPFQMRCDLN